MNPTSIAHPDAAPARSIRQRQDQLDARMWDRARKNLMLLYNGGQTAGPTSQAASPATLIGPLAVANPEF